ncbi:MAG: tRNA-dihydrouridine synthase family protein [Proteobacteria bacterium]|nr:tRNA-dihydrouridine synthase family protein [Pseudomonadota bacterium]
MLAPMQGLTNRALRSLFIEWVNPDVVFTEFVRVRPTGARRVISEVDRLEAGSAFARTPLVVQLIGNSADSLGLAAESARQAGATHLNINLGCPYGRMNAGSAGGALLKNPEGLAEKLLAIRNRCAGTFSVKVRSGYDDPEQIFSLLPIFEECRVDFLIIHPRTVLQKFRGRADHEITARIVESTSLPVIANGDVVTAAEGKRLLEQTGAAGLMLGRGAIRDPMLFQRLRGLAPEIPEMSERIGELRYYLQELASRYHHIFQGDAQVLNKIKTVVNLLREDDDLSRPVRKLLRAGKLENFMALVNTLS